jgi:hypothetical protein
MSKVYDFLDEYGFVKNEHGVYIYESKDGKHSINIKSILEDFEEYEEKKYLYASVYSEDSFEGIRIPNGHADLLRNLGYNFIMEFTTDKDEFHEIEVEGSRYAKDGSRGIKILDSIEEFKKWFIKRFEYTLTTEVLNIINEYEG